MTDLEIMIMLEEYNYEPSVENVIIFKEEAMTEADLQEGIHFLARHAQRKEDNKTVSEARLKKRSAKLAYKKAKTDYKLDHGGSSKGMKDNADVMATKNAYKDSSANLTRVKGIRDTNSKVAFKHGASAKTVDINSGYDISDYELYQILDESGYKPTEKNLAILKEGLETGKYVIE